MNAKKVSLVFRKDWREIRRNWQVLMPIVLLPIIISVALPLLINIPSYSSSSGAQGVDAIIKNLPASVQHDISGLPQNQVVFYVLALYFFAPLFLIIPLMTSSVIASDSFAGEKERKTIEALLATPITDSELFIGKVLVSFIPSMIITVLSFLVYSAIIDFSSISTLGSLILPNLTWLVLIFGLSPAVALISIGVTVMISSKVKGFREAQQLSAIMILPILALLFSQISGAIVFGPIVVAGLAAAFALADLAVFYVGVKRFRREEILSRI